MTIVVTIRKQEFEFEGTHTIRQIMEKLSLSLEAYLAVKDGELLNENDVARDGDKIQLIAVISGGSCPA